MEIRDLTPDDFDAMLDIRRRSFGPVTPAEAETWRRVATPMLAEGRYLGVFDGARLAGAARLRPFTQWWHGRAQPMGGVAGVTVNPEDRGRGVGRQVMTATVERAAELGEAVSVLFPATTPLYRSLGWEHAGGMRRATLPTEALRTIATTGSVKIRRMGPEDAAAVIAVLHRVHGDTRASGPISWDERTWRLWLAQPDDFLYLADDGYLVYRWKGEDIEVHNLVAGSEATARALWSMVGTSSSIAKKVIAHVGPDDPVLWLLRERTFDEGEEFRWMFRVVDVAAAVERRGYPATASLDVVLEVDDPVRGANSGRWRVEVSGGSGMATAVKDGSGEVPRLGIGALSALYTGVPTATLRRTGLLHGPRDLDEHLDAAFAAKPYMIDHF